MAELDVERKPPWLRTRARSDINSRRVRESLDRLGLRTVCDSSRCPNLGECWGQGHATFMILGGRCSRRCLFCAVPSGPPEALDEGEAERLAEAVRALGLRHVVITSVTRDDLPDGGAEAFATAVRTLRWQVPGTAIELLIPDLQADRDALMTVVRSAPNVLGHNLETVRSMQWVRDGRASYERSLAVLENIKEMEPGLMSKSGLMLGLGEEEGEVKETLKDLRSVGTDLLTVGQYLRPRGSSLPVRRYVTPGEFEELRGYALRLGFVGVMCGPLVRSSYNASNLYIEAGESRC